MINRETLPWLLGALLVILGVLMVLWLTTPEENTLPQDYDGVM
jgi:hypothetical protein